MNGEIKISGKSKKELIESVNSLEETIDMKNFTLILSGILKTGSSEKVLSAPSVSVVEADSVSVEISISRTDSNGRIIYWQISESPDFSSPVSFSDSSNGAISESDSILIENNGAPIAQFYFKCFDTAEGFLNSPVAPVLITPEERIQLSNPVISLIPLENSIKIEFSTDPNSVKDSIEISENEVDWTLLSEDASSPFETGVLSPGTYFIRISSTAESLLYIDSSSIGEIVTETPQLQTPTDIQITDNGGGEIVIKAIHFGTPPDNYVFLIGGVEVYDGPNDNFVYDGLSPTDTISISVKVTKSGYLDSSYYNESYTYPGTTHYVTIEQFGGNGYYKLIENGLSYSIDGSSTIITSSSAIFEANDLGKRFCGLFAHQNPDTPDNDLFYPGIVGSRYANIIEVISNTQIRVDFEFNEGSEKGYVFFDNSDAIHDAIEFLLGDDSKTTLRLNDGKTYVVPVYRNYEVSRDIYVKSTGQSAIKLGYEDYFQWSKIRTFDQGGSLFNVKTNSVNVAFMNVDILPPSRVIKEASSASPNLFKNETNSDQACKLAVINCNTSRELDNSVNVTEENPTGWGWGFLYAGGKYSGEGESRTVSDFNYLIAKNYSHRGQGLMDLKATAGGGIYLIAENIETDYDPKSDFNPNYFLTSIRMTTDKSGFLLGIPSKTHYPGYVPEITDSESFYKICNIFFNQGWNYRLNIIHIDRFTFYMYPSSYIARVYDPLFDRSGSLISWDISDSYTDAITAKKAIISVIPEVGETYRISRHYSMGSGKVMGPFSDNVIRDHINWCAVLNKSISSIDPVTEIPLNSKPIELQPGDQFTIVGYGSTVYTVTSKERGPYPNIPFEYQWFNPGEESQYIFNMLTLDTNLPNGLPVDFEIEITTSSAEFLLDGNSRPAYGIYKGNSAIDLDQSTSFGDAQVLYSAGFGYISYNHKEITLWAKNFNHRGYYRQSSNGRPIVSPSDISQGYVMINCTGFEGQFNPDEPIQTSPTEMPSEASDFISFLESL